MLHRGDRQEVFLPRQNFQPFRWGNTQELGWAPFGRLTWLTVCQSGQRTILVTIILEATPMKREVVILSAYRESVLAAAEKGLKGPAASTVALKTAAAVAGRLLKHPVTVEDVRQVLAAS